MERKPLEVWGGLECTIARIGDDYRDQSLETGPPRPHRGSRPDRRSRHPHPALSGALGGDLPRHPDKTDFSWSRRAPRAAAAARHPRHRGALPPRQRARATPTCSIPPGPELLARQAANVAARYPHLDLYTPVNEPLTTSRFSGLYGHWYPHGTSDEAFLKMLVAECKATVLSMRAIRR
jgi:dTDP-4-dehydrorhamnose reductase